MPKSYTPCRQVVDELLAERDLAVAELARLSGVHRVALSRWLNGHRDLTVESLDRVLEALGLELAEPRRRR